MKASTSAEQVKSLSGRLSRWANVSKEGKNNRVVIKEAGETKASFEALKKMLGAVNQVFTLLKENSVPRDFVF